MFPQKFEAKTDVTVSIKYQIQPKKVFATAKIQKQPTQVFFLFFAYLQRPAQVFSCEYCEIFNKTYFEKHLWTAASENQGFNDKFTQGRYFLNFPILLIKAFSI